MNISIIRTYVIDIEEVFNLAQVRTWWWITNKIYNKIFIFWL